LKQ
jgi:tyrosinase